MAMLVTTLLVLYWPQPPNITLGIYFEFIKTTVTQIGDRIGRHIIGTLETMFKILADIGWMYWIFLLHMTVHVIVYMFYQKGTSGYNRASRQRWKRIRTIGQHVTTLATKLGDMIERNLQSDRTTR